MTGHKCTISTLMCHQSSSSHTTPLFSTSKKQALLLLMPFCLRTTLLILICSRWTVRRPINCTMTLSRERFAIIRSASKRKKLKLYSIRKHSTLKMMMVSILLRKTLMVVLQSLMNRRRREIRSTKFSKFLQSRARRTVSISATTCKTLLRLIWSTKTSMH
jgi:hypothetical protein